jgi:succinyl-CoA synthetase alpha subunit
VGVREEKGNKTRIIGPNCPGIITPGEALVGITPANITGKGPIGLVSKSGTLTYQMMFELRDLGFSTAIGIGGDPIIGTTHIDALAAFEADPETKAIVMIGEIGGDAEERAAEFIKANVTKPVVGYVAGFTAPRARRWATPAPSSPARRAPRRPRRRPSRPPASRSARPVRDGRPHAEIIETL